MCGVTDEQKAEVETFLRNISRPIMGKAKAKQSAGQRALDITKQSSRLDDVDMDTLLRMDSAELKKRGERAWLQHVKRRLLVMLHFRRFLLMLRRLLMLAGVPVQERRRILNFAYKVKSGWTYEGKEPGDWKAWKEPKGSIDPLSGSVTPAR